MRQIKFMAWDGTKMLLMHEICTSTGLEGGLCSFEMLMESISDMPLMQFTGLKDKNGKEIYEGDIIGRRGMDNTFVEYYNCRWVLRHDTPKAEWRQDLHNQTSLHLEVIGNIYEHEYLLHENKNGK